MKIAVFHNLPHGGAKRATYEWVTRLSLEYQVDLYLVDDIAENFLNLKKNVNRTRVYSQKPLIVSNPIKRILSLIRIWFLSKKIVQDINSLDYDVALIFQCQITNTPIILRKLNIPSLYICHETLERIFEPHYTKEKRNPLVLMVRKVIINLCIILEKKSSKSATLVCTTSLYSIETLYKYFSFYPQLIYPGVKSTHFKPSKIKKSGTVLSVGHLSQSKGHEFIIKSLGTIKKERPKLIIVHKLENQRFDYRSKLQQLADANQVEVEFKSSLSDKELIRTYQSAKITLCGYHLEPLGLVALESLSCGTPVISVEEAGLRETVINNYTGFLCPRDIAEFGNAISKLYNDDELIEEMGQNGIQEVYRRWSWDFSTNQLKIKIKNTIKKFKIER